MEIKLPVSVTDYLCYRNSKSSLQELRFWLGDARFYEFVNTFAGSYIILPTSKKIQKVYYEYLAALTIKRIKEARKNKDIMEWNKQESVLHKIAKKTKRKYKSMWMRGTQVLKEMEKVQKWVKGLQIWEKKYLKQEDDKYEI